MVNWKWRWLCCLLFYLNLLNIKKMPDITKCDGWDCPWKIKCWRYASMPSEFYQAYFIDPPYKKVEEVFTCDHFWPIYEDGKLTIDTMDKD